MARTRGLGGSFKVFSFRAERTFVSTGMAQSSVRAAIHGAAPAIVRRWSHFLESLSWTFASEIPRSFGIFGVSGPAQGDRSTPMRLGPSRLIELLVPPGRRIVDQFRHARVVSIRLVNLGGLTIQFGAEKCAA